jgi:uncharacterized membrane protein YccC
LLSLFSFVVKFGLMVQISDLWVFLLFLLPLLTTMQLLKLQMPKLAGLWGQLIVFMGSFISVTNPPVYDSRIFSMTIWRKFSAWGWRGWLLRFCARLRCAQKPPSYSCVRRGLSTSSAAAAVSSEFESLVYHHVSQLSNSQDALARRWLLRWGVVLLNCSHVVWQLRDWEARSDPLSKVRDLCLSLLRDVMSERGVQQRPLASRWRTAADL